MSFLANLEGDRPDRVTPERVYASIDPERSGDRGSIVLEAIEADWFDHQGKVEPFVLTASTSDLDRHVSLVEVRGGAMSLIGHKDDSDGAWFELMLRTVPSDDVLHFPNLFAAPDEQQLDSASRVPPDLEERLRTAHSLDPLPDAPDFALASLLGRASHSSTAAVYDVGQGACSALVQNGTPRLYFDFGGGCLWNTRTFPSQLRQFCFTSDPAIVLSHWDTDHWAAAPRDPRSLSQQWIVPRQTGLLRPNQLSFLIAVIAATPFPHVHIWGHSPPALSVGRLTVERCTGVTTNDSGLALMWNEDDGDGRMLFPADASYDDVPAARGAFTSLVVAHHGGRTGARVIPPPDGTAHGRLVYSYGLPNRYGHPLPPEEAQHTALWGTGLRTPIPRPSLGHVHLYWSNAQPDAVPACGGRDCQLDCCQR